MTIYKKPEKRVHRGFYYLDDETVINSLSAIEAGRVDEIVAKVNSVREGGFGAGLGIQGAKLEGAKKSASSLEEEMVRTRTRFSMFEIWHQTLTNAKAVGRFSGWGKDALSGVQPGDTIELRAELDVVPLQTMFRLYMWFAEQAKTQGSLFAQSGQDLKSTKESERIIRILMGPSENAELLVLATPVGDPGPQVAMPLADRWMIGQIGHLSGQYSIVGQVERVLAQGEEFPALRLTRDAPPTPLEVETLKNVVSNYVEPSANFGVTVSETDGSVAGPALWLNPIAIYR